MTGFVYAIEDGGGRVKIGWSRDPSRRLVKLRSDCPSDVRLSGMVRASLAQEAEVHRLLAPWRIGGEWFDAQAPAVAAFISMLPRPETSAGRQFGGGRKHPLAQYRSQHRVTLKQLAAKIGISHGTLSRYECGKVIPSAGVLRKIRELTGISADAIVWSDA